MLFGVDDSEVLRVEQKLRNDRLALAAARRALKEQCGRTLTRPSTLALLLAAGGLAGARSKAPETRRASSLLGTMLRPILKGVATLAVERALHWRRDELAAAPRREHKAPENAG